VRILDILKSVLKHEVYPALGCTEPIAVAYASAIAGQRLGGPFSEICVIVDPGVYKNGFGVNVPNTGGGKGNLLAGVLGAIIKKPELGMEILKDVGSNELELAHTMIREQNAKIVCDSSKKEIYIDVTVKNGKGSARAVIEGSHTNLVLLEKDNQVLDRKIKKPNASYDDNQDYKNTLRNKTISDLVEMVDRIEHDEYEYIKQGIDMNLKISEAGKGLKKVGYYLSDLLKKGYLLDDVFSSSKILVASAADARMDGMNLPVMSSGGSGNQGIVAVLVPYNVGKHLKVGEDRIVRSVALSHLINSYIKCFTGELSPLCGCAIAAGVGAAVAIVYQQCGKAIEKITLAVNNVISDLGGMLCDGAKGGCALKVATSADSAIRSAFIAINDYGISEQEGFVGKTAEETIRNLAQIANVGMSKVNHTILGFMLAKGSPSPIN